MDAIGASAAVGSVEGTPGATAGAPRVARDAVRYALGGLAGKVAGVLLLPFLARAFGPEAYGRFDILNTIAATVPVILAFGLDAAATRLAFTPRWADRRSALLGVWLGVIVATMAVSGVILLVGAEPIARLLFGSADLASSVRWLALIVPLSLLGAFVLTTMQIAGRATAYAVTTGTALVLNAFLTVITRPDHRLADRRGARRLGDRPRVDDDHRLRHDGRPPATSPDRGARRARALRPAAPPGAGHRIGGGARNRSVLLVTTSATEVAYLSVGIRVASMVSLAGTAFLLAWRPRAYATDLASGRSPAPRGCPSAGSRPRASSGRSGSPWSPTPSFEHPGRAGLPSRRRRRGTARVRRVGDHLDPGRQPGKRAGHAQRCIAVATAVGAILSVVINLVLVSANGAIGTAVAMTIGPGVGVLVAALLARRHGRPTAGLGRVILGAVAGAVGIAVLTWLGDPWAPASLVVAAATSLVVAIILLTTDRRS